jgi:hypothetical protein
MIGTLDCISLFFNLLFLALFKVVKVGKTPWFVIAGAAVVVDIPRVIVYFLLKKNLFAYRWRWMMAYVRGITIVLHVGLCVLLVILKKRDAVASEVFGILLDVYFTVVIKSFANLSEDAEHNMEMERVQRLNNQMRGPAVYNVNPAQAGQTVIY